MTIYKEYRVGANSSPLGFLGPLLILAVFFTSLFFLVKGLFWLLSWAAPVLLIITLILDYHIVTDFIKFLWKLLKENTIMGLLVIALVILGFPFVTAYLFFKALAKRSVNKLTDKIETERNTYIEYEEVNGEDNDFLELPVLGKSAEKSGQVKTNEYDDMFK